MLPSVLNVRGFRSFLAGGFPRRQVRVVIADVMMIVVDGTLAIHVAVGSHQASLRRWNVVVTQVTVIALAFNRDHRQLRGWDGRW